MKKENKVREVALSYLMTKDKVTTSTTVCYQHKSRYIDQCYRIGSIETEPHVYGHLAFDKSTKAIQCGNGGEGEVPFNK